MPVQWGLANQGGGFDYLESLTALGNIATQRQNNQTNAYKLQEAQRIQQQRATIAPRAQAGDLQGAQQQALAGGDFDYAEALGKLNETQMRRAGEEAGIFASVASNLRSMPMEQRAVALQSYIPSLKATGYFSDEELAAAAADLSDGRLDGAIATGTSLKDRIDQQLRERTIAETERHNRVNEGKPRWQFDSESGSWLQEPGTGNGYTGPDTIPQNGYTSQTPAPMQRMLEITAMSESGGRETDASGRRITSPKGAQGIMQVMPGTQRDPGYGVRPSNGTAEDDARVGREYLGTMLQRYGDPAKAWAAYNAGPGRLEQALQRGGDNWLAQMPRETQEYVRKNLAQLGSGQAAPMAQTGPGVVPVRPPKRRDAPSGYRWSADGSRQEPIPGGPADPAVAGGRNPSANRKAEADFRKEFKALPAVKTFEAARPQFQTLRSLATKPNPTAADDIALIFAYMKTLDPTSVVREGEFATAQNAGSVPESIWNMYNRAREGTRLNPEQRGNMAKTAQVQYLKLRDAYNQEAENYRGYAQGNGVNPDRVARRYVRDSQRQQQPTARQRQFRVIR